MTEFIETIGTTSSEVPFLSNIFVFFGDILQAGYDFVTGLAPETPNGDGDTTVDE